VKDDPKALKNNKETVNVTNPESLLRNDLDAGLRHLHFMSMQTKHDLIEVTSRLFALIEELIASEQVDLRSFDERRLRLQQQEEERLQERAHVQVDNTVDKYELKDFPQIDCKSRFDLCKARCCRLTFPLSFQDLDEGIMKWIYSNLYLIRQKDNGYCLHHDCNRGHCLVYENRPSAAVSTIAVMTSVSGLILKIAFLHQKKSFRRCRICRVLMKRRISK
jgi:hypothetical protein